VISLLLPHCKQQRADKHGLPASIAAHAVASSGLLGAVMQLLKIPFSCAWVVPPEHSRGQCSQVAAGQLLLQATRSRRCHACVSEVFTAEGAMRVCQRSLQQKVPCVCVRGLYNRRCHACVSCVRAVRVVCCGGSSKWLAFCRNRELGGVGPSPDMTALAAAQSMHRICTNCTAPCRTCVTLCWLQQLLHELAVGPTIPGSPRLRLQASTLGRCPQENLADLNARLLGLAALRAARYATLPAQRHHVWRSGHCLGATERPGRTVGTGPACRPWGRLVMTVAWCCSMSEPCSR